MNRFGKDTSSLIASHRRLAHRLRDPAARAMPTTTMVIGAAAVVAGCVLPPRGGPSPGGSGPRGPAAAVASVPPVEAPPAAGYAGPTTAMYFYPERGQPDESQDRDRFECYRWAVRETGFDPGMTPTQRAAPPVATAAPNGAGVVVGAATGAMAGAAISGPRRPGEGAVVGAIFGAMLGAAVQQSRQHAYEQQAEARQARIDAQTRSSMDSFRRAMSACMGARGYRAAD
jgi:hypothetical protein